MQGALGTLGGLGEIPHSSEPLPPAFAWGVVLVGPPRHSRVYSPLGYAQNALILIYSATAAMLLLASRDCGFDLQSKGLP